MLTKGTSILIFPRGTGILQGRRLEGVGRGHVMRCIALARQLRELAPDIDILFAACGEELELARKQAFEALEVPAVGYNSPLSEEVKRVEFEAKLMRVLRPSVVLSDTHEAAVLAAKISGVPCVAMFNLPLMTSYPAIALIADLILIPDIERELEVPSFLRHEKKVHFTGPILSRDPSQSMDRNALREKLNVTRSRPFITTYAGRESGDRKPFLENVAEGFRILKKKRPLAKMLIVASEPHNFQLEQEDIHVVEYVPNLAEYVAVSDLTISRGGHNLTMQTAALGVPCIIVPIKGEVEQEFNAKRMERLGYAHHVPMDELAPQTLAKNMHEILEGRRESRVVKLETLESRGAEKATNLILSLVEPI